MSARHVCTTNSGQSEESSRHSAKSKGREVKEGHKNMDSRIIELITRIMASFGYSHVGIVSRGHG
jgi:hypothetical protein